MKYAKAMQKYYPAMHMTHTMTHAMTHAWLICGCAWLCTRTMWGCVCHGKHIPGAVQCCSWQCMAVQGCAWLFKAMQVKRVVKHKGQVMSQSCALHMLITWSPCVCHVTHHVIHHLKNKSRKPSIFLSVHRKKNWRKTKENFTWHKTMFHSSPKSKEHLHSSKISSQTHLHLPSP